MTHCRRAVDTAVPQKDSPVAKQISYARTVPSIQARKDAQTLPVDRRDEVNQDKNECIFRVLLRSGRQSAV